MTDIPTPAKLIEVLDNIELPLRVMFEKGQISVIDRQCEMIADEESANMPASALVTISMLECMVSRKEAAKKAFEEMKEYLLKELAEKTAATAPSAPPTNPDSPWAKTYAPAEEI